MIRGMSGTSKLYKLREERGLKRSYVAEKCEMPVRTLEKLERGEQDVNKTAAINVYRLAQVLGVDVGEILEIDG